MVICYVCIYVEAMPGLILLNKMVRNWIPFPHQLNLLNFLLSVRGKLCFFLSITTWKSGQISINSSLLIILKFGKFQEFEHFSFQQQRNLAHSKYLKVSRTLLLELIVKLLSLSEHTSENNFPVRPDHFFRVWCSVH